MNQVQSPRDEASEQARYEHLRTEAARVGMERQGDWKGFQATYWFRCRLVRGAEINQEGKAR